VVVTGVSDPALTSGPALLAVCVETAMSSVGAETTGADGGAEVVGAVDEPEPTT
jgi:hypothetical protein